MLTYHQIKCEQIHPKEGWVEMDPMKILSSTYECMKKCFANLEIMEINPRDVVCLGITNQRETTILWDKVTGNPLYNAIGEDKFLWA